MSTAKEVRKEYLDPQRIPLDLELPGFTLDAQELFLQHP